MTTHSTPIIVLFRQDLRLNDNPALMHAVETGRPIIPLYILDDQTPGKWKMGGASRWWLHHSLMSLDESLRKKSSQLFLLRGETLEILSHLVEKHQAFSVYWNRCYEPYAIQLEKQLKKRFPLGQGFNASLLFEPWDVFNKQGDPFKVFTPFWNRCREIESIERPLSEPPSFATIKIQGEALDSWNLLPKHPDWSGGIKRTWKVGEKAAQRALDIFIDANMATYEQGRDVPSLESTSTLSPHLHFGEISPRQVFYPLKHRPEADKFLSEIGWREFSYYQLYHFTKLPEQPWRAEFSKFPWEDNAHVLESWQKGLTGYPIIDAGMRQLWATGWMHNRVRMICASFLVKDLFIPWQQGAEWFWDTLVDADLASNSASWQWVAGCGFDAAPFFRIFNPVLQSEKFDPQGTYIKRWVPELANVPAKLVHEPWKSPLYIRSDYPAPIVSHDQARKKALEAFKKITHK